MRKINNVYAVMPGYNCFACNPDNKYGLKMSFFENDDEIISEWQPQENFQGYKGILHGGIQATLLDETASWYVNVKLKTAGVTSSINVKFLKPVRINNDKLTLKATLSEKKERSAIIKVGLFNNENVLCAEAYVEYFIYPEEIAKRKFNYPGYDAFVDESKV